MASNGTQDGTDGSPGPQGEPGPAELAADVVVIGTGLAGALAALAAARAGASVIAVAAGGGASALGSGALDLAADPDEPPGTPWRESAPLAEELVRLGRRRPWHPLGRGRVREAVADGLQLLAEAAGDLYPAEAGLLARPNRVVATELGTWYRTALVQRTQGGSELTALAGRRVGVLGLRLWPAFDAGFVARSLEALARRGGESLETVALLADFWRERGDVHRSPVELARALEAPAGAERLGQAARAALDELARAGRPAPSHLLVPAVLGLRDPAGTLARFSAAAGLPASEVLAAPTSVPGLRLRWALDAALDRAGARRLAGRARPAGADRRPGEPPRSDGHGPSGPDPVGARLEAVEVVGGHGGALGTGPANGEAARLLCRARAFVLATGRFVGGGIVIDPEPREATLGLPLYLDGVPIGLRPPAHWFEPSVLGRHAAARLGVAVDDELRPLDAGGRPAYADLRACGDLVAGHDYVTDRSGLGTALATGALAGRLAAEHARAGAGGGLAVSAALGPPAGTGPTTGARPREAT